MDFAFWTTSTDFFWSAPYFSVLALVLAAMKGADAPLFPASAASAVPSHAMNAFAASWSALAEATQNPSIGASSASAPMAASSSGKVKKSRSSWVSLGTPSTTKVPSRYIPHSPLAIEVAASCQVRPRAFSWW